MDPSVGHCQSLSVHHFAKELLRTLPTPTRVAADTQQVARPPGLAVRRCTQMCQVPGSCLRVWSARLSLHGLTPALPPRWQVSFISFPFYNKKGRLREGELLCPQSHSCKVVESGSEGKQPGSRTHGLKHS